MKKYILFLIATMCFNTLNAQLLYTENFDNLAVGEVSTDPTGATPGKGNWYVRKPSSANNKPDVVITPENGRGNVLAINIDLSSNPNGTNAHITQKNINTLWNNRTVGNNVLKLEYDVYITSGSSQIKSKWVLLGNSTRRTIQLFFNNSNPPTVTKANLYAMYFDAPNNSKTFFLGKNNTAEYDNFPYNTWLSVELFIDYKYEAGTVIGGDIYVYIPTLNIFKTVEFTHNEIIELLQLQGGARETLQQAVKYDNIKLTALQTLPSYILSTNEFITATFNVFPNPATNVVTITNNENMVVEQVTIYDISGKTIHTQSFNKENEVQLSVENLANGTYMLHIQTTKGTAVKKLVKK